MPIDNDPFDETKAEEGFRGKRYGTSILKQLSREAKKLGVNATRLEVEKSNKIGNKLCLKHGFKGNDRSLLTKVIS